MKIKREQWEALNRRVKELETDLKHARSGALMHTATGDVYVGVIVPKILKHLGLESRHGHHELLPAPPTQGWVDCSQGMEASPPQHTELQK